MDDAQGPRIDEDQSTFAPRQLDRMVITPPLLYELKDPANDEKQYHVIIDLNLDYPEGRQAARRRVRALVRESEPGALASLRSGGSGQSPPYLFARLTGAAIKRIVAE